MNTANMFLCFAQKQNQNHEAKGNDEKKESQTS
jgi:hypothetical protein